MAKNYKIMIVAGEASGDKHAASLVRALRAEKVDAEFEFFGCAGPLMRAERVEAIVAADDLSVVGVAEIAGALPMFWKAFKALRDAAVVRKPDVVVLVDFPDFNLKLARSLKKRGLKTVYFISPQLWAWRQHRVRAVAKYVDLLLTILPFEKDWYAGKGFERVEFVGNPLASEVAASRSREEFCEEEGLSPLSPLIAILPGSRNKEIIPILPAMIGAAIEIEKKLANAQFAIAVRSGANRRDVDSIIKAVPSVPGRLVIVENSTYDTLASADAAMITSGTATLEAGIIGTPMVIAYRGTWLNYVLLRPLISVEHFGLINLIYGERIAKELIQHNLTPHALASEVLRLLEPEVNSEVREKLAAASAKLGTGGASKRAGEAILRLISD